MRTREKIGRFKPIILIISKILKIFGKKINFFIFRISQNLPTNIGVLIRYVTIKNCIKKCGWNICIKKGVIIKSPENLVIGDNVSINENCFIDAEGTVEIGNDISIAHMVSILSFEHKYTDKNQPIKDQGLITKKVVINNNVWIGAKATILSGVTIETGVIVGANAVITKNCQRDCIYGGVPGRMIKERI